MVRHRVIQRGDPMKRIAVTALLVLAGTSYAQSGDPARGSTLYHTTYKCTDCHGDPPNPALPGDKFLLAQGTTAAGILASLTNSPEMLKYASTLGQNPQDLADLAAYIATLASAPPPPPPSGAAVAVEYYYADWNFYFITSDAGEIAALDGGAFGGLWKRTGQTFNVWSDSTNGALATYRFFSTGFAPKSSHFYTPYVNEYNILRAGTVWEYEGIAFYVQLPDANGNCPAGTVILYRLYNNGMGGAPNHRFTISVATFNAMKAAGYIFEGNGLTGAYACVPQ